ncbi:MAG: VPLPA-CTERM-specific exosortase XrtD [Gammaproteobacteria bacterium]|nr:VPLPA-CTERM-specific exosortase XrtD [Gammaproteobacteria bacterium]
MSAVVADNQTHWRGTGPYWLTAGFTLMLIVVLCWSALAYMAEIWFSQAEYSHGVLIPFISAYLVWQRWPAIARDRFEGSWGGVALVAVGLAAYFFAELATLYILVQYAFLLMLNGAVLALLGWRAFRHVLVPLLILAFMVPLPTFLYNNLSSQLQLLSSQLGVAVVRMAGISVFLEGNVIDLGSYKLQVAEACNGLRYLFPLTTLGFIVAYFYDAALWKRAIVFVSAVPITVLMNSFRIGVIAVMVNYWGQSMAEGFLHEFEGWVVFMACFSVLFVEMWLLLRVTNDRRPLRDVFGLEVPAVPPAVGTPVRRHMPKSFYAVGAAVALALIPALLAPHRQEVVPSRKDFDEFPTEVNSWSGTRDVLEKVYIDALKFTDYALINFKGTRGEPVTFYVAYYESQRKGQSAHSPRSCLPGGGWRIESLTQTDVEGATVAGHPLRVNRVLITYGDQKQLVYYWFQQRGRIITNEYLVKWYMFVDAIRKNRTDGALVRLTMPLGPGVDPAKGDAALSQFSRDVAPELAKYIPN